MCRFNATTFSSPYYGEVAASEAKLTEGYNPRKEYPSAS